LDPSVPVTSPGPQQSSRNALLPVEDPPTPLRRSSRKKSQPPHRLIPSGYLSLDSTDFLVAEQPEFASIYAANGVVQPYSYKASNSDPDTLSYEEAMRDVDKLKWIAAAEKEIKSLEEQNTWTEVDISEATSRVLPSQWVFKRKRTPDGNIKSYKGRTVARGDLEEGVFDTYSPVVVCGSFLSCL
jgi:hypothetical protein